MTNGDTFLGNNFKGVGVRVFGSSQPFCAAANYPAKLAPSEPRALRVLFVFVIFQCSYSPDTNSKKNENGTGEKTRTSTSLDTRT